MCDKTQDRCDRERTRMRRPGSAGTLSSQTCGLKCGLCGVSWISCPTASDSACTRVSGMEE
jgi:hypothetical protein